MNDMSLAQKIVQSRKMQGLSQEELSNRANISLRTLQRIEKAETEPRGHTLRAIAEVLEVPVEELMDFSRKEDRGFLQVMSLSALSYWIMPLLNILVPLVLWLFKRDKIQGADKLGKEIISFQILWTVLTYGAFILFASFKIMHLSGSQYLLWAGIFLYFLNVFIIIQSVLRIKKGKASAYPVRLKFI